MMPQPGLVADSATRRRSGPALHRNLFFFSILICFASATWQYHALAAEKTTAPDEKSTASASHAATSTTDPTISAAHGEFKHGEWPFQPLSRPSVPILNQLGSWARNQVDAFIGQKLEAANLKPSPRADKLTLLRRVTFDLTGLAPTPAEQAAFLADRSPDAYAKVVDRLLASPRYGERWAQHWLDLARYSETEGFKHDGLRPDAHRYRDYVIRAYNDDVPYNRFIREQLAGDELEPKNPDALIATGFVRLYPEDINASNMVQQRQEILDNITENTGLTFLGMTLGCARCHDHKFDEIKQSDYYRWQACFAAILPNDDISIASKPQVDDYEKKLTAWEAKTKQIRDAIDTELADERQAAKEEAIAAYDPQTKAAIETSPERRSCLQKQLAAEAEEWIESRLARAYRRCSPEERQQYDQQVEELAKFDKIKPDPLPTAMTVFDGDGQVPATYLLSGGDYHKPQQELTPGFPVFLGASEPEIAPPTARPNSTGRRTALAEWLARDDHPLTARVMINRVWQYHFGQGIVATPNDFGAMGGNPSHPELLDWLASEFVANGWHLKPIHRLMALSATYCQSSKVDPATAVHAAALAADAANNLLWHARRQRLEGEEVRDAALEVSGQLNLRMYGPSAQPQLPQVLEDTRYGWYADKSLEDRNRRSIYVLAKRNMRLPLLEAFDQPDMQNSCPRRTNTITAPQALEMLNGELTEAAARQWGGKLLAACGDDEGKLVREAYTEAYGRAPQEDEIKAAEKFVDAQTAAIAAETKPQDDKELPVPMPAKMNRSKAAAVVDFCHAILCSNEFLYVD